MDYIRDQLESFVRKLELLQELYITELDNCPPGSLVNNNLHGKSAYYHAVTQPDGKYKRTRINLTDTIISALARKKYLKTLLPEIEHNIRVLKTALSHYRSLAPEDIIKMTGRACRLLPDASFFGRQIHNDLWDMIPDLENVTDEMIRFRCDKHRFWAEQDYEKNTYPHSKRHFTSFGLRTRSRGETVIAERLHHYGVPFRHDQIVFLDDGFSVSPDFSFEGRYSDEFYWEYCGMMDDPDYASSHIRKRQRYERNGIVPWKNVHYTYSTDDSLDVREIDSTILYWIIPRL